MMESSAPTSCRWTSSTASREWPLRPPPACGTTRSPSRVPRTRAPTWRSGLRSHEESDADAWSARARGCACGRRRAYARALGWRRGRHGGIRLRLGFEQRELRRRHAGTQHARGLQLVPADARLPSASRSASIGRPASSSAPSVMSPDAPAKQSKYNSRDTPALHPFIANTRTPGPRLRHSHSTARFGVAIPVPVPVSVARFHSRSRPRFCGAGHAR